MAGKCLVMSGCVPGPDSLGFIFFLWHLVPILQAFFHVPGAKGSYSLEILPCATGRPTKESRHPGQGPN